MDLELRTRHGCTIVGVGRQGYLIALPGPETVLYPRDKLLLIGTPAQIEAGRRYLSASSSPRTAVTDFDDVRMEVVIIPSSSPASGRVLRDVSPSQHYRIQIAGIRRQGTRILNPAGEETVCAGDELLVLGAPDDIRNFKDWVNEAPDEI